MVILYSVHQVGAPTSRLYASNTYSLTERVSRVLVGFDDEGKRPVLVAVILVGLVPAAPLPARVAWTRREPQSLRGEMKWNSDKVPGFSTIQRHLLQNII